MFSVYPPGVPVVTGNVHTDTQLHREDAGPDSFGGSDEGSHYMSTRQGNPERFTARAEEGGGDGFTVPPEEQERQAEAQMAKRWEISCPFCCAHRVTTSAKFDEPCEDCGFRYPLIRGCGDDDEWPAFDWARFLFRHGEDGINPERGFLPRCVLCRNVIGGGQKVRSSPRNRHSVAHRRCLEDELGIVGRMLADGETGLWTGPPTMCNVSCLKDVETGQPCYTLADLVAHVECVDGPGHEPPLSENDDRDPCEWNPLAKREARPGDPWHARAEFLVGSRNAMRLCKVCRGTPPHSRKRKEVPISPPGGR